MIHPKTGETIDVSREEVRVFQQEGWIEAVNGKVMMRAGVCRFVLMDLHTARSAMRSGIQIAAPGELTECASKGY